MSETHSRRSGEFTGVHMALMLVAFFFVIIAVNLTMAIFASSSWTGLVVKNTYVASQEFNNKAEVGRAQAALGWNAALDIGDGRIAYRLTRKGGSPVHAAHATVTLRRPVTDTQDRTLELLPDAAGTLIAETQIADGSWIIEIDTEAGLDHPYRDVRRISIAGGRLR
ncbi:MAG: FixH family protein [Rhizobiaceae bacterium]|nr:FixH family protein [Rhizobiaceae bacterium]